MSRLLHALAGRIVAGSIDLTTPDGHRRIHRGGRAGPDVAITVHDPRLAWRVATGGAAALGASFVARGWETDDLPGALRVLGASVDQRVRSARGQRLQAGAGRLFDAVAARWGTEGAVDTMVDHYNLGNAFYTAWLDDTVTYSSALFPPDALSTGPETGRPPASTPPARRTELAAAQRAKYDRILDHAGLAAGDRVLEIGCGWGGFAEAAATAGVQVTGVTIADEQLTFAAKRLAQAGLSDRVDLHLLDFADIPTTWDAGTFDAVVSIEMIESIPQQRWADLFSVTATALRPGGRAVFQVIEIADDLFETYAQREDFITTWIFPGGRLPSPSVVRGLAGDVGLDEVDRHAFGASYARTLATWWRDFDRAFEDLREQGFDDRFRRMWHYYLGYCQAGFELGRIDVGQWTWTRAAG